MFKKLKIATVFLLFVVVNQGCGVKGKPLPPLQDPFISSGNYQEDLQKKQKDKKKSFSPPNETKQNGQQ